MEIVKPPRSIIRKALIIISSSKSEAMKEATWDIRPYTCAVTDWVLPLEWRALSVGTLE